MFVRVRVRALCVRVYSISPSVSGRTSGHTHTSAFDHYRVRPRRLVRCPTSISPLCIALERSATVRSSVSGLQNMVTARVVGRHSKSRPCSRSFWSSHPAGACFPCRRLLSEPAAASFAEDDQSRPTRWPGPRPPPTPWSTTRLPRLHAMRGAALAHLIHHAPLWKRSTSLKTTAQRHAPSCSADNDPL